MSDLCVCVVPWLPVDCVTIGNVYYISPALAEYLISDVPEVSLTDTL